MKNIQCLLLIFGSFVLILPAWGSFKGLDESWLKDSFITFYSRPCCSFSKNFIQEKLGITSYIDLEKLGEHNFGRIDQKDKVGLAYTCTGGFIDVSHMRDNADWSAHLLYNLPTWLGSGEDVTARLEGGFRRRSVYFPPAGQAELESLTEEDRSHIAISIAFNLSVLHEIATSFNIAVSLRKIFFIYEKESAFSVEDLYSNLLGNHLGILAAHDTLPYNEAITKLIKKSLTELGIKNEADTRAAHMQVVNDWWKVDILGGFSTVRKRNFTFKGEVKPLLIKNAPGCQNQSPKGLSVPERLSNGRTVHDYYVIKGLMSRKLKKSLAQLGLETSDVITQEDFDEVIKKIREKFTESFGVNLDQSTPML